MRLWELDSELQAHPDVGIRTLKDLTKDELIYLLHECCTASTVNYALCDVANKRCSSHIRAVIFRRYRKKCCWKESA